MKLNYTQRYKRFDREVLSFLRKDMKRVRQTIKEYCNELTTTPISKDLSRLQDVINTKERTYSEVLAGFHRSVYEVMAVNTFDDVFDRTLIVDGDSVFRIVNFVRQVIPFGSLSPRAVDSINTYLLPQNKELVSVIWTSGSRKDIYGIKTIVPDIDHLKTQLLQKENDLIEPMSCEAFINHSAGYFDDCDSITLENLVKSKSEYMSFMGITLKQLSREEILERLEGYGD